MNEEMTTMEEIEVNEEVAVYDEPDTSGSGCIGKLVVGGLAIGAAVALWFHKTKDKREAKKIKKLEKKGYVIYAPGEISCDSESVSDENVDAE